MPEKRQLDRVCQYAGPTEKAHVRLPLRKNDTGRVDDGGRTQTQTLPAVKKRTLRPRRPPIRGSGPTLSASLRERAGGVRDPDPPLLTPSRTGAKTSRAPSHPPRLVTHSTRTHYLIGQSQTNWAPSPPLPLPMAQQLPCVSSPRPLLAVPAGRWRAGVRGRPNVAGLGRGRLSLHAAAARPVAEAVQAEEDDDDDDEEVAEERFALGGACRVLAGMPAPLGATALRGGVNFAVYSSGASAASLCLFAPGDLKAVSIPHP